MTVRASPPPLVLLAGGLGRRFGGDKQVEPVGPAGEPLGAYSAFDARIAGFGEIVLVTRPGAEAAVTGIFAGALGDAVPLRAVPQALPLPDGVEAPPGRTRPWGTAHATLAAAATLGGSLAVANADDAYGREAFEALHGALADADDRDAVLVTYPAGAVLSAHGGVSRGWVRRVPAVAEESGRSRHDGREGRDRSESGEDRRGDGTRVEVVEVHDLRRRMGCAMLEGVTEAGAPVAFPSDTPVSMNLWGLTPGAVAALRDAWEAFARTLDRLPAGPEKAEFQLSTALTQLAREGRVRLRPVPGGTRWFGMTYADDLSRVRERLRALHSEGTYPERLADGPTPTAD